MEEKRTSLKTALQSANCEPKFFPYSEDEPAICCRVIVAGEDAGFCAYKLLFYSAKKKGYSSLVFNCERGDATISHSWRTGTACSGSTVSTTDGVANVSSISMAIGPSDDSTTPDSSSGNELRGMTSWQGLSSLMRMTKWTNRLYFADRTSKSSSIQASDSSTAMQISDYSDYDDGDTIYVDLQNLQCKSPGPYSLCTH